MVRRDPSIEVGLALLGFGVDLVGARPLGQDDAADDRDDPGRQEEMDERDDVEPEAEHETDTPGDQRRPVVLDALEAAPIAFVARPRKDLPFGEHDAADGHQDGSRVGEDRQDAAA